MIKQWKVKNKALAKYIYGDEKYVLRDKIQCAFFTSNVLRVNGRDG